MTETKIIDPSSCKLGVMPIPLPVVLVSYKDNNESGANLTTVSYAGQVSSGQVYVSLRPTRNGYGRIKDEGFFGMNYVYPAQAYVMDADYCGLVSGRDVDKFLATGLTKEIVDDIPLVGESPLSLTCSLKEVIKMDSHDIFIGQVLSIIQRAQSSSIRGDFILSALMHMGFQYFPISNNEYMARGRVMEVGKELKPYRGVKNDTR